MTHRAEACHMYEREYTLVSVCFTHKSDHAH
eukprot:SAG22_NODE_21844_length_253_cov_1.012987_1_plen_30_part_01